MSRMPDLPLIHRKDNTLHTFVPNIIEQSRDPTSQQVLRKTNNVCPSQYEDQNDRNAKNYWFKTSPDPFLFKNQLKYKDWGKSFFHHASLFLNLSSMTVIIQRLVLLVWFISTVVIQRLDLDAGRTSSPLDHLLWSWHPWYCNVRRWDARQSELGAM